MGARQDAMIGRGLADMRRGRQHRERGARQTGQVAVPLAAAQQSKELHHVRQAHAVGIPTRSRTGALSAATPAVQS